jgi:cellulose synthase/poly-beta-1,6-N-acetylglucosamine synthase-like glycosyltransferase
MGKLRACYFETDKMKKDKTIFLFLVICFYLTLTIPWVFWPFFTLLPGILMFGLYSLLALGLAIDTTEVLLTICWRSNLLKIADEVPQRQDCAIVMTVCDDAKPEFINLLHPLTKAGYDVYLLDDSLYPESIPSSISQQIFYIRRSSRFGAKAGNLNHWLSMYRDSYKYIAILDADSVVPVNAMDTMLLAAQNPENSDVAIFQSKIGPIQNPRTLFAQVQGVGARPRAKVFERVHCRIGCLLSFGHNQLVRLDALAELGGFDETLSCEDTVLSLELASKQWRTELVDTWTYDSDPDTVAAYIRRSLRWARQTVELFNRPWYDVPLRLKLLLCRHLLNYTLPLVGFVLLFLSLWSSTSSYAATWNFLKASLCFDKGYLLYGLTLWPTFTIFLVCLILQTMLAVREGISIRLIFLAWSIGSAPYLFMLSPLAIALTKSAFGRRVDFVSTGSKYAQADDIKILFWATRIIPAFILLCLLGIGIIRLPGSLLVGFNAIWIAYLLFAPVALSISSMSVSQRSVLSHSIAKVDL